MVRVEGEADVSGSFTEQYRIVQEHCGQPKLPSQATRAIRTITRRSHDAQVWTWAARCLGRARPPWAYRCYRRAVRLDPDDLALAEEAGMFGLTAIGARRDRNWTRYLVAARADPVRRARVDPILVPYARELVPAASIFVVVGSLFGMLAGASTVRRGRGIYRALPEGVDPLPPIAGIAMALAVLLVFVGLYWLAMAPLRRFGRDILSQVFRWPPRPIYVVAAAATLLGVVLSLDMAAIAGRLDAFNALAPWVALCYLVTIALGLLCLPARTSLRMLIDVVRSMLSR